MDSSIIPGEVKNLLFEALSPTEGIGVFDADDRMIYCNQSLASFFGLSPDMASGMTFDQLIEHSFNSGTGLNFGTDSLETWLSKAHKLRRSKKFRRFELDCNDGRWFLVKEYTAKDKCVLIACSEITQRKNDED